MRRARVSSIARLRRPGEDGGAHPEADAVPVDPNRPSTLDGGAAAALTFED